MFGFLSEWYGASEGQFLDAVHTNSINQEIRDAGDKISRSVDEQTFWEDTHHQAEMWQRDVHHQDLMNALDQQVPSRSRADLSNDAGAGLALLVLIAPIAFIVIVCKLFLFLFSL